jgi:hypothetical protein
MAGQARQKIQKPVMTFLGTIIGVKMQQDTHFCTQMRYGLMLGRNALRQCIFLV